MNWLIPAKRIEVNLLEFEEGDLLLISLDQRTPNKTIELCVNRLDNTDLSSKDSIIMPSIKNATIVKPNGCQIDAIEITNENQMKKTKSHIEPIKPWERR